MKILIMNGSPHRGNTWRLTQRVKEMIHAWDETVEFSEVHLMDVNLPFCTGCSNCFRRGHQYCLPWESSTYIDLIEDNDAVIFRIVLPGAFNRYYEEQVRIWLGSDPVFHKKRWSSVQQAYPPTARQSRWRERLQDGASIKLPAADRRLELECVRTYRTGLQKAENVASKFYLMSSRINARARMGLDPSTCFRQCADRQEMHMNSPRSITILHRYAGMQYAPGVPLPLYKRLLGVHLLHWVM